MTIRQCLYLMILLLVPGALYAVDPGSNAIIVVMPKGDYASGREAFLTLACNSCHVVLNDHSLPQPQESTRGPNLGGSEKSWTAGYQATSIIAPSHLVAYGYLEKMKDAKSPMPDLTERMTVRQLIDLLAYLNSLDPLRDE